MASISAVILTKNEEANIARCIESCIEICDEILVIDSGSTDKTKDIANSFTKTKVIECEWRGFSETKNYGNSLASSDYILSLDADEALSKDLKNEIAGIKANLHGAYRVPRLTNYCGQWIYHSGWRPDYQTRLFPRQNSRWNANLVHEKVELSSPVITSLKGDLLHYSYKSISEHLIKMDNYTTLSAQAILKREEKFLLPKAIIRSKIRFFLHYIFKLGFLDGFYGFVIACSSSMVVFLKYIKAIQMKRSQDNKRK